MGEVCHLSEPKCFKKVCVSAWPASCLAHLWPRAHSLHRLHRRPPPGLCVVGACCPGGPELSPLWERPQEAVLPFPKGTWLPRGAAGPEGRSPEGQRAGAHPRGRWSLPRAQPASTDQPQVRPPPRPPASWGTLRKSWCAHDVTHANLCHLGVWCEWPGVEDSPAWPPQSDPGQELLGLRGAGVRCPAGWGLSQPRGPP